MIKGLIPQLAERGKIKIGEKGEEKTSKDGKKFMLPKKLDHFLITTMQRDAAGRLLEDKTLAARLTPEGGKLLEIPIRLLYDDLDLNFQTRLSCYKGNRCWCSGDSETASRLTEGGNGKPAKFAAVACPCERQDPFYAGPDKCKSLGTLQALIDGVDRIGGVWKFRTTSWNSVNAILSSLALIKTITGGILAGIPLHLVLSPKTVTIPTTGQNMVVFVVSIEYRGPESQLAQIGYELAKRRVEHRLRMENIEDTARKQLMAPHQEPAQEQQDTAQEFFPEGAVIDAIPEPEPELELGKAVAAPLVPAPSAITFPVLMDMVHAVQRGEGPMPEAPIAIASHEPGAPDLATVTLVSFDKETHSPSLTIRFADNLAELVDGLTPEKVIEIFGEAGIIIYREGGPPEETAAVIPAQIQAQAPKGKGAGVALF